MNRNPMRHPIYGSLLFAAMITATLATATNVLAEQIAILPGRVALDGSEARQRLIVERLDDAGNYVGPATQAVKYETSDPKVVVLEDDVLRPLSNGTATVVAEVGDMRTSVEVSVTGMEETWHWSFRNHVQPVLTKTGCNSGACHGALAGKGGLKLSLRGYDTARDWNTLTREARGRRIEPSDPASSLILIKPTGTVSHKGGVRFDVGSREYEVLVKWIADGAQAPAEDDARLERLQILPEQAVLAKDAQQPFIVLAHFSDGRVEEVTRWVKFTGANEAVARVDENGLATVVGHGEGAISAWYLSQLVIARITSPFPNRVDPEVFTKAKERNFIDELVLAKLQRLQVPPASLADDQEFLRRVYLDAIGTLPTSEETIAFLADSSADKRDQLIEELLARPEFVDYWSYKLSDLFLVNGRRLRPQAVNAYYDWIRKCVAENKPWDQLAREVVTAVGDSFENGATNFYALHQDPLEMTENLSVAFLGLNLNCARCHNHPLEKWTNDQYYGMANLFARVRAKGWGGNVTQGDGQRTLIVLPEGDLVQPSTGRPQEPRPLDAEAMSIDDPSDRRVYLAQWLTSPENEYFSRAIANRIWANFFGIGIVEPVDDLRISNPASNEELLSGAAQFLVDNKFDLKSLMRAIMQSHTYQRTSEAQPENQGDTRYFSRYYPRRLMAEVMLDAVSQVIDVPSEFTEISLTSAGQKKKTKEYPRGTRALQLKDSAVVSPFLKTFGRNERMITCDCERSSEPSMVQALHIANGDTINKKLAADGNRIDQMLKQAKSDAEIIDDLYLRALSRHPSPDELQRLLKFRAEVGDAPKREWLEDVYWSVLSSREFLFNH